MSPVNIMCAGDLLSEFDVIINSYQAVFEDSCVDEFLKYSLNQEQQRLKYIETANECKRLENALSIAAKEISAINSKLLTARRFLNIERLQRSEVESENKILTEKLNNIREVLLANLPNLPDPVKENLSMLDMEEMGNKNNYLSTIIEVDSVARSEDELGESNVLLHNFKKHRVIDDEQPIAIKRRRSTLEREFIDIDLNTSINLNDLNNRKHKFVCRNALMPERCVICEKRIRFGQNASKCTECHAVVHSECCCKLPLPCVSMSTPTKKGTKGILSDYAPSTFPQIPALVVHCIKKIEQLGLNEIGLYRVPGNDKDVRQLKEKFLKCKGVPSLENVEIHTLCGCLKDFLRNLDDPVIPHDQRENFSLAVSDKDNEKLRELLLSLPQSNRHTLAFIILHLQHVASNVDGKMPVHNLATVFGPTLVGLSTNEPNNPFVEAQVAISIVTELLQLPQYFLKSLLTDDDPSENNVLPSTPTVINSPICRKMADVKNKRFFPSPMSKC